MPSSMEHDEFGNIQRPSKRVSWNALIYILTQTSSDNICIQQKLYTFFTHVNSQNVRKSFFPFNFAWSWPWQFVTDINKGNFTDTFYARTLVLVNRIGYCWRRNKSKQKKKTAYTLQQRGNYSLIDSTGTDLMWRNRCQSSVFAAQLIHTF